MSTGCSWGSKQAYRVIHQPVSCGLAVFADGWLAVGLACGDQRRLMGSGNALEALRDDVLYKSTYFTFTLLHTGATVLVVISYSN